MTKFYWISGRCMMVLLCFLATVAWSQSRTITGKVTSSDDGAGLPGVNIVEKGTQKGTVTDVDGNYSIQADDKTTLVFSFVGYASQEVLVGNQTTIAIVLGQDISTLNEVVVIGYGNVKKSDATGAVAVIEFEGL